MTALPRLLTTPEVAEALRVPVRTIHLWRSKGIGPVGTRLGKRIVYKADDVAEWFEAQVTGNGAPWAALNSDKQSENTPDRSVCR